MREKKVEGDKSESQGRLHDYIIIGGPSVFSGDVE